MKFLNTYGIMDHFNLYCVTLGCYAVKKLLPSGIGLLALWWIIKFSEE
jgi:hypothetical protein